MVTYGAVADEPEPPARVTAPPVTPVVNAGPRLYVPSKPLPDESFATVPPVSSKSYRRRRPGAAGGSSYFAEIRSYSAWVTGRTVPCRGRDGSVYVVSAVH